MKYNWDQFTFPLVNVVDAPTRFLAPTTPAVGTTTTRRGHTSIEVEAPPMKVSWIPEDVPVTRENLLAHLSVTEGERKYIWSIDQREPAWHRARAGRLTGSRVGAAASHNPYSTPANLIHEWLYVPVVDNAAMKHGRDNEGPSRDMYRQLKMKQNVPEKQQIEYAAPPTYLDEDFRQLDDVEYPEFSNEPYDIHIDVRGLVVHPTVCHYGYSSDGEIFETTDDKGLLEIKCPRKMYPQVPWMYYDQIQFGMYNLGLKWCDFWVWTPQQTSLNRYSFNEQYWEHDLHPKLETFYHDQFLPAAIEAIEKERAWKPEHAKRTKSFHI